MAAPYRALQDNHDTAMNSNNRGHVVYFINFPFFMFLSCVTNTSLCGICGLFMEVVKLPLSQSRLCDVFVVAKPCFMALHACSPHA